MKIQLRALQPEDKELYLSLQREYWVDKKMLDEMREELWNDLQEEKRINYVIAMPDGEFCGFCGVKNKEADVPEIEIEILEKFTGQGIGSQAMTLLLKELKKETGKSCYLAQIIPDNYPSIRLMQKCGATPYKVETYKFLLGDEVEDFVAQHTELISEEMVQLAGIFGVSKERILGGTLHFHIHLENLSEEKFRFEWKNEGKFERRVEKEMMRYTMSQYLARIRKIGEVAAKENSQKLKQMLEEDIKELKIRLKNMEDN